MDVRWDPFSDLAGIRDRINRLFDETLQTRTAPADPAQRQAWAPRTDISETAEALVFEVELPGVDRQRVEIDVQSDRLTISGERKPVQDRAFVRVERPTGSFHRSFAIGVPIEHGAATAHYCDGVLEIVLPKAQGPTGHGTKVPIE